VNTDPTRAWLATRLQDSPPELALAIRRLLECAPSLNLDDPPSALACVAVTALEEVAGGAGNRSEALRLLAADATLTYAFEAAAEAGTVAELAARFGVQGELGRRLIAASRAVPAAGGKAR
jgi:hypothetical protein